MEYLPSEDDRDWLLDHLAALVRTRGHATLVCAPILAGTPRWFPEPLGADPLSLRVLAVRLLGYAGLDMDAEVQPFDDTVEAEVELNAWGGARSVRHQGAAAWYAGTEDGVCWFGCSDATAAEPAALLGTMAHEVAHAYRHHHGLMVDDRDTEELLTDLTTVYLGKAAGAPGTCTSCLARRFAGRDGLQKIRLPSARASSPGDSVLGTGRAGSEASNSARAYRARRGLRVRT